MFVPRDRMSTKPEVPCRADSYLWAKMARISGYGMHLVIDSTWPPRRDAVIRLVAQPFIDPEVLVNGAGADEHTLQHAAAGEGGIAPLVLRPAVVDSLELKMSKMHPEFIAEFVSYGKQQQLLHSADDHGARRGRRQVKASSELVLLMDLYEWLASVLTHNQRNDVGPLVNTMRPAGTTASRNKAMDRSVKPGGPKHHIT